MLQHDLEDLSVCFLHTVFSDLSHTADGLCGFFLENSCIRCIRLPVHGKMMRQEGCVKTGCDLGSTGDLGPITDDSRNIGEGIFDRFFDQGNISAPQKADSFPIYCF